nr:hypothetical protein [Tanacetum cinerariifolium]
FQIVTSSNALGTLSQNQHRLCLPDLGGLCVSCGAQELEEKQRDELPQIHKETVKSGAGKDSDEDDDENDDDDDEEDETAKDDKETKETGRGGDEVRKRGGESKEEKETSEEEEVSF